MLVQVKLTRNAPQHVVYGFRKAPGRNPIEKLLTMDSFRYCNQMRGSASPLRWARISNALARQSSSYSINQSDRMNVVKVVSMVNAVRDFLAQRRASSFVLWGVL